MSSVARTEPGPWDVAAAPARRGRPGWVRSAWSTSLGLTRGSIVLFALSIGLYLAGLAPGPETSLYAPFAWGAPAQVVAGIGWSVLAVAVVAPFLASALDEGFGVTVSRPWVVVGLAAIGNLADVTHHPLRIGLVGLVLWARWVVLLPDGAPRAFPLPGLAAVRRPALVAGLAGLVVVAAFSITHPLQALGSGGQRGFTSQSWGDVLRGSSGEALIGLHLRGWLPVEVTGVEPVVRGSGLRVVDAVAARERPTGARPIVTRVGPPPRERPRHLLGRALAPTAARPLRLTRSRGATLDVLLRRAPCTGRRGRVDALRVRYRLGGVALTQRVRLDRPLAASC